MTHELKILPEYFHPIMSGTKTFEVRFNDRNFSNGDILCLKEYSNGAYTGSFINVVVTYILDTPAFCKEGFVIMGIKPINK